MKLLLLLLLLLLPIVGRAQFTYTTNDGAITITGYSGPGGTAVIPNTLNGLPVASIGGWAFYATSVANVLIPDTVTNIGDGAFFDCELLTNVTLGSSVATVGDWAFGVCHFMESVCCRGNAPSLGGDSVFYENSATIYYLPGATGWGAAFNGQTAILWNPQIPFAYTTNSDGITLTITGYAGYDGYASIPGSINFLPVSCIGDWSFYGSSVHNVLTPDSVTHIGDGAFFDCESLTNITLGNSVTNVGDWTFGICPNLASVCYRGNAPALGGDNVFYEDAATIYYLPGATGWGPTFDNQPAILWNPDVPFSYTTNGNGITLTEYNGFDGTVNIPANINFLPVVTMGDGLFIYQDITNVIIPNSVTSIGAKAFFYCLSLNSVDIPNSVTNIGRNAFSDCWNLASLTMSTNISDIGIGMFYNCFKLSNFTIPACVTSIENGAFYGCRSFTNIAIPNTISNIDDDLFSQCVNLTNVTIPNNLTNIGAGAFAGCSSLRSIIIPNTVTGIGDGAFQSCTSLASLTVPDGVSSIGYQLFEDCASLTNVVIPNGVTSVGIESFSDCTSLINIAIPASATNIGDRAFNDCSSLTSITVNSGNSFYQSVDGVLFNNSQTLLIQFPGGKAGSYVIPNNVTSIGDYAFSWSYKLSALTIPNSLTTIDTTAFIDCTSLTTIAVDAGNPLFSSVDGVLFNQSQTSLIQFPAGRVGSYTIPNSVTNIGDFAFCTCIGLTGVTIPNNVISLGYESFAQCSSLTSIIIPSSVTIFGGYTFYDCASLNSMYFEGSAPTFVDGSWNFFDSGGVTVYYVLGTTFLGWQPGYAWPPNEPWLPQVQMDAGLGVQTNQFGFNINWASGQTVVVEASTNLANPDWQPVQTNTLATGTANFSDPQWTNYPNRFYRLRSP